MKIANNRQNKRALIVLCSLIICACSSPFVNTTNEELPEGYGSFSFSINAQRTILPAVPTKDSFTAYELTFTAVSGSGGESITVDRTNADIELEPVILKVGTYDLVVDAFNDAGQNVAQGTLNNIVINNNTDSPGTVILKPLNSGGSGTFSWDINITTAVTSAAMVITPQSGSIVSITLNPGVNADSRPLASGRYNITITLRKEEAGIVKEEAVWNEILYIYKELTSHYPMTFGGDFFYSAAYTVTLNYNDDDVTPNLLQSVTHGGTFAEPTPPARTGYTFGGWYTDSGFTEPPYVFTTPVYGNLTLYAKWNINKYTVNFQSNGGSLISPITNVNHGSTINRPDPVYTGYTLENWYKESNFTTPWNFASDTVTENITLYAKWNINQYTVTFNANGGTPIPASQTINYNGKVSEPAAMTKANHTFAGWYKEEAFTNTWNFASDTVNAPVVLHAKWVEQEGIFTDIDDFDTWLSGQTGNDANHPYTVKLNVTNASDLASVANELKKPANSGKYISLDLSGSTITSIGAQAFEDCAGLTSITIPSTVEEISYGAFEKCESLTSITIPASVMFIRQSAFHGCKALTSVTFATGTITSENFEQWAFPEGSDADNGNTLRTAYLSTTAPIGGAGTYTRAKNGDTWTKQP